MHHGSCSCGAISFTVAGDLPPPDACHCVTCRKHSSHYFVSSDVPKKNLTIYGKESLRWYHSSEKVRRGFCHTCGSPLFWEPLERDSIGIAMGALQNPTHTHLKIHVWVSEKGDYYQLTDQLPQKP